MYYYVLNTNGNLKVSATKPPISENYVTLPVRLNRANLIKNIETKQARRIAGKSPDNDNTWQMVILLLACSDLLGDNFSLENIANYLNKECCLRNSFVEMIIKTALQEEYIVKADIQCEFDIKWQNKIMEQVARIEENI